MSYITNLPLNGIFNITAYYGQTGSYWPAYHRGMDFTGSLNVYSVCNGTVRVVSYDPDGWGNYISIEPKGFPRCRFIFAHLQTGSIKVKPGEKVTRLSFLAKMGKTGNVTGVHLHVELKIDGDDVDPSSYFGIPNRKANGLSDVDYKTTVDEAVLALQKIQNEKDGINPEELEKLQKENERLKKLTNTLSSQVAKLKKENAQLQEKIDNAIKVLS